MNKTNKIDQFILCSDIVTTVLMFASNLLIFGFVFLLSTCNRLNADDFSSLGSIKNCHGIGGSLAMWYQHWTGRMFSMLIIDIVSLASERDGKLFTYSLVNVSSWIIAVTLFFHRICVNYGLPIKIGSLLNFSIYISGLVLFASFARGDSWFWLSGSANFLLPTTLILIGASMLMSRTIKPWQIGLATVIFACAAGCNEFSGLLPLCVILSLMLIHLSKRHKEPSVHGCTAMHRFIWPFLGVLSMCILVYAAPGNQIRMAGEPKIDPFHSIFICPKIALYSIWFSVIHRAPWLTMAFISGFWAGIRFHSEAQHPSISQILVKMATLLLVLFASLCVTFAPASLALQDSPPFRAWIQPVTLIIAACFTGGLILSQSRITPGTKTLACVAFILSLVASCVLTLMYIKIQAPIVQSFAKAYDARFSLLLRHRDQGDLNDMTVELLPDSRDHWINTFDISADPHHWMNEALKSALRLKFDVRMVNKTKPDPNNDYSLKR